MKNLGGSTVFKFFKIDLVSFFDLDDSPLDTVVLERGDCTITFRGGHTYAALEEGTTVYVDYNGTEFTFSDQPSRLAESV